MALEMLLYRLLNLLALRSFQSFILHLYASSLTSDNNDSIKDSLCNALSIMNSYFEIVNREIFIEKRYKTKEKRRRKTKKGNLILKLFLRTALHC